MSTIRLKKMIARVEKTTTPWTVGKSKLKTLWTARRPSPGRPKMLSVKMAPPSAIPMSMPSIVTTGRSAFRSTAAGRSRRGIDDVAVAGVRQDGPVKAERVLQHQADQDDRHRDADEDEDHRGSVHERSRPQRGEDPDRDRERHPEDYAAED